MSPRLTQEAFGGLPVKAVGIQWEPRKRDLFSSRTERRVQKHTMPLHIVSYICVTPTTVTCDVVGTKKGPNKRVYIYFCARGGGCRNKPRVLALVGFNSRKPCCKSPFLIYCQNRLYAFNSGRSSTMVLNRLIRPTLTGALPVQVLPDHIRRRSDPARTPNSNCSAGFWSSESKQALAGQSR